MDQSAETEAMGPWLQFALICQTALTEAAGQLSIIRIFDRMILPGNTPTMSPQIVQLTLVVAFKSGSYTGNAKIGVRPMKPNGEAMPPMEFSVLFEGAERGNQLLLPIGFPVEEDGLYWFDISVNGQRYTRVPLRLIYQQMVLPGQMGFGPPQA